MNDKIHLRVERMSQRTSAACGKVDGGLILGAGEFELRYDNNPSSVCKECAAYYEAIVADMEALFRRQLGEL